MPELQTRNEWFENDRYYRQETLTFRDCDVRGRVRPGAALALMAVVAGQDYAARGLGHEELLALRQVFLLSRLSFRLHRYPLTGDTVTLSTWEAGVQIAHMRRDYEFTSQDGAPWLSGKSEWILVDPVSRRILRPSAFEGKPLEDYRYPIDCPDCQKILLPKEGVEEIGVRPVRFSDLDHNGHLFSGNYGEIVWDYLPAGLQNAGLLDFQINYRKEATLGEALSLRGFREGNTYRMEGLSGEERCFTCACTFLSTGG